MTLLDKLVAVFNPFEKLIDNVHTSSEEKMQLSNELAKIKNDLSSQMIKLESQRVDAQEKIIVAEAKSESWIASNWRPITALVFVALVVAHWLGFTATNLHQDSINGVLDIVQVMIGGYVVSRGGEKIVKEFKGANK